MVWLSLLATLPLLSGCSGFKLRGSDAVSYQPLAGLRVMASEDQVADRDFLRTLKQELRVAGAVLLSAAEPDVVEVQVTGIRVDKTVSAYSSVRQVREFNHYAELDFTAQRKTNGPKLAKPTGNTVTARLRAERVQVYDSRYVLGVSEEERVIQDELRAEVARLLALRLAVLR